MHGQHVLHSKMRQENHVHWWSQDLKLVDRNHILLRKVTGPKYSALALQEVLIQQAINNTAMKSVSNVYSLLIMQVMDRLSHTISRIGINRMLMLSVCTH
mmetsp:Transcript_12622/g.19110  ORF Transcript_12622/g.19110 Transcript_12622/m.19110 type:complete len:100 (+) Transcript_12622:229-528(+)